MVDTTDLTPVVPATPKPGWQTTEFWMSLVAILVSFLSAQHVFPEGSWMAGVLSTVVTVLAALGYMGTRAIVKSNFSRASIRYNDTVARLTKAE